VEIALPVMKPSKHAAPAGVARATLSDDPVAGSAERLG
jgi:hypothetical protein